MTDLINIRMKQWSENRRRFVRGKTDQMDVKANTSKSDNGNEDSSRPVIDFPSIVADLYTTERKRIPEVIMKLHIGLAIIGAICGIFFITTISPVSCKFSYSFTAITSLCSLSCLCLGLIASVELNEIRHDFNDAMVGKGQTLYPTGISGPHEVLINEKSERMELKIQQSLVEAWGITGIIFLFAIVETVLLFANCRK